MKDKLVHYKVKLHTVGPVYIGSGKTINKKEYIYERDMNTVAVLDLNRFFTYIIRRGKSEEFEKYLNDSGKELDFYGWLMDNGITKEEYDPYIRYRMSAGDVVVKENAQMEVHEFMKDPHGCVYIPGSSLKGVIRTALLAKELMDNPRKFKSVRDNVNNFKTNYNPTDKYQKRNFLSKEPGEMEAAFFNTLKRNESNRHNAVNDFMGGLIVRDSEPISADCLVLCQKVDLNIKGENSLQNSIPLLRECIKPKTEVCFDLVINTDIFPYTRDDIVNALKQFNAMYTNVFAKKFSVTRRKCDMYIGGGVGFVSKTVLYALLECNDKQESEIAVPTVATILDANLPPKIRLKHGHDKDAARHVSPHMIKCTYYDEECYEMGACEISIEP